MRRIWFGVAVLTVALSACDLRAEITVNDDGSGTMGMVFAVEPETLALMSQAGAGDPFAEMRADLADDPVKWTVRDYAEGNLKGIHATFDFSSIADLRAKTNVLNEDSGGDAAFENFSIEKRGDGWIFSGKSADARSQFSSDELPIPPDQLEKLLNIQFRVTLPGAAGSHNAAQVATSGGRTTFIWKPSVNSSSLDLRAQTSAGGGSSVPMLPIALGLGVVAAAAAAVMVRRQRAGLPAPGEDAALPSSEIADIVGAAVDAGVGPADRNTPTQT